MIGQAEPASLVRRCAGRGCSGPRRPRPSEYDRRRAWQAFFPHWLQQWPAEGERAAMAAEYVHPAVCGLFMARGSSRRSPSQNTSTASPSRCPPFSLTTARAHRLQRTRGLAHLGKKRTDGRGAPRPGRLGSPTVAGAAERLQSPGRGPSSGPALRHHHGSTTITRGKAQPLDTSATRADRGRQHPRLAWAVGRPAFHRHLARTRATTQPAIQPTEFCAVMVGWRSPARRGANVRRSA